MCAALEAAAAAARLRSFCPSANASAKVGGGVDVAGSRSGRPPIAPTATECSHTHDVDFATDCLTQNDRNLSEFIVLATIWIGFPPNSQLSVAKGGGRATTCSVTGVFVAGCARPFLRSTFQLGRGHRPLAPRNALLLGRRMLQSCNYQTK